MILATQTSISIDNEHFCAGYFIDIALVSDKKKVAVEVNGPSHYDINLQLRPVEGFRNRLLKKKGWNVVEVPFFIWDKVTGPERLKYLRDKLSNIFEGLSFQEGDENSIKERVDLKMEKFNIRRMT